MYAAMQYVTKMGGLVTDLSYPYKGIEVTGVSKRAVTR